jgi:hypothetical protein
VKSLGYWPLERSAEFFMDFREYILRTWTELNGTASNSERLVSISCVEPPVSVTRELISFSCFFIPYRQIISCLTVRVHAIICCISQMPRSHLSPYDSCEEIDTCWLYLIISDAWFTSPLPHQLFITSDSSNKVGSGILVKLEGVRYWFRVYWTLNGSSFHSGYMN